MQESIRKSPPRWMLMGALLAASTSLLAAPVTYTLDPNHTQALFTWTHFGFSKPTANFNTIHGTLVWDAEHPRKSSVKVSIPVASIDTHVPALDEHMKNGDFFDAAKYPQITFASTRVVPTGEHQFDVTGNLTVHGVTKPVTLHATLNQAGMQPLWKGKAIGFNATGQLKRSDFGLNAYVPKVSDTIELHITTEAIESKAYAAKTGG